MPAVTTTGEGGSPRSPEAKLGMQVEDLWDVQEPQLSPTEKLNACFESVPVSAFPPAPENPGTPFTSINTHIHVTYIYIYIYMFVCVCVHIYIYIYIYMHIYRCNNMGS